MRGDFMSAVGFLGRKTIAFLISWKGSNLKKLLYFPSSPHSPGTTKYGLRVPLPVLPVASEWLSGLFVSKQGSVKTSSGAAMLR